MYMCVCTCTCQNKVKFEIIVSDPFPFIIGNIKSKGTQYSMADQRENN